MATRVNNDGAYLTAALGDTFYHRVNLRIELKRLSTTTIKGCVLKSPFCKNASFEFSVE